jgi:protein-glutamine gamma-glutamyltransferase
VQLFAPARVEVASLAPLGWACAAFAGGVALHMDRAPAWATTSALALIAWRLATARGRGWYPRIATRAVLTLVLVAIVLGRFHTLNGLAAGTTLLMVMAGLKLLETRGPRDQFVIVGAGLFLLLSACLEREDLARVPLYVLQAWLCCAALAVIAAPGVNVSTALKVAGRALLLALPLAVLLFMFFPRLPGAFWAISRGEQAVTGLSDTMSPASIGQLATSYAPAFRVTFAGDPPPEEERYWRGPVLHEFDGQTWRRTAGVQRARTALEFLGNPYRYRETLEPTHRRWWYPLETPPRSPDTQRVELTDDGQLLAAEPVFEPVSFEGVSYTHTRSTQPLDPATLREDSSLPRAANPRARALAQTLRARSGSDTAFVQAVLDYLRTGGFTYSLEPEKPVGDAIDDFLFRTRVGFCGHYASAFVVLMRAAGIPARVVTGYLGGEWNPFGGYYLVRQSDAHAWAEVWLTGRGWTRVDPTAVVSPDRLHRGILELMPDGLSEGERLLHAAPWLAQRWDAVNAWWTERVVKFDYAQQLDLLARFGVHSPEARHLGWAFMLALCVWLAIIAWHIGASARPPRPDALARAYQRLCRKLARVGLPRAPHLGPLGFAAAVIARRPDLEKPVHALLTRYAQLRYGPPLPGTHAREIEEFRRAVARLSLSRGAAMHTRNAV